MSHATWEIPKVNFNFAYEAFTLYGQPFQIVLLSKIIPYWAPATPRSYEYEKGLVCYAFARRY